MQLIPSHKIVLLEADKSIGAIVGGQKQIGPHAGAVLTIIVMDLYDTLLGWCYNAGALYF